MIYLAPHCWYTCGTADQLLAAQRVLWVLCLSAQTLLIGALLKRRLWRAYPLFAAYLALDIGFSIALVQVPANTVAYAAAFRVYQTLEALMQLAIAAEMFQRLCWHFREFRGFARFRFFMATVLLAVTSLFFLAVLPGVPSPYPHLLVVWIERWESAVLAITPALAWWVLTRFLGLRPQIRSNALAHGFILTAFFAINAISYALVLIVQRGTPVRAVNVGLLTGILACMAAWMVCLRRDGEQLAPEPPVSAEVLAYSRAWRRRILEYVQQAGR